MHEKATRNLVAIGSPGEPLRYCNGATRLGETNRRFPWIFCRCHEYLLSFGES